MPHVDFSILVVIQPFCSVSSCPGKDGLLLMQISNSLRVLYLVNELATMVEIFEVFAQKQREGCSGLSSLKTYDSKDDILPTCDFFLYLKDSLVS